MTDALPTLKTLLEWFAELPDSEPLEALNFDGAVFPAERATLGDLRALVSELEGFRAAGTPEVTRNAVIEECATVCDGLMREAEDNHRSCDAEGEDAAAAAYYSRMLAHEKAAQHVRALLGVLPSHEHRK